MKHLKRILFVFLIVFTVNNLQAQDENNPWALDFGTNVVDFFPTNHSSMINSSGNSAGWFDEFSNADDHYNFLASPISRIHVGKYINDGFSLGAAVSFNNITKVGEMAVSDMSYIGVDMGIKYDLNNAFGDTKFFDPYVSIGGGYTFLDEEGNGTLNGGLGANFWFTDNLGVNVQSLYKHSFDDTKQLPHFQHALGLIVKFGGTDTDGDGIYDKNDACPEIAGLEAFNGCPDTDGDGIKDSEDACPNAAGTAVLNGCPDIDGDGIADKDDACPEVKGAKENNGCPDSDNDGVIDSKDKCLNEKGPKANNGCPWPDSDGDGVLDKDDNCPKVAGVKANKGCPKVKVAVIKVITKEAQEKLDSFAKTIFFNSGKSSFKQGVSVKLDAIYDIMKEYPGSNFSIDGHTDSQGSKALNKGLSQNRADAVKTYLVSRGLSAVRLSATGFGEEYPIDTNKTRQGRANNRRVEFKLVK